MKLCVYIDKQMAECVIGKKKHARNASQSQRANFDVHGMRSRAMFSKPPFRNSSQSASNLKMLPWQGPGDHEKMVKLVNLYKRKPGMTFPNEKKSIIVTKPRKPLEK